jgi:hypothetical protein
MSGQPNPTVFPDAAGSGAVGVIGRRARSKGRRVSFCCRRRLTRRPKNAGQVRPSGQVIFGFFKNKFKFLKKIKLFYFFVLFPFL